MRGLVLVPRDRRRAQRGSVLSGVLIMVAFLAILAGALMTELSTNFLLSTDLLRRASTQATVDSAVELALNQLQNSPISSGCPSLSPVTLNGTTAAVAYLSCAPVVDVRSPQFVQVASSSAFNVDGVHASVAGQSLYLVGDSGGNVYQYRFGDTLPTWSTQLPGVVSGRPIVIPDMSEGSSTDMTNLVPLSVTANPPSGCQAGYCVADLAQDAGSPPDGLCFMPASGPVTAQPAAGVQMPDVAYFGDRSGGIFAYSATQSGACALQASANGGASQPVVAGPVVFNGGSTSHTQTDEVLVVVSNDSSTKLLRYTYVKASNEAPELTLAASLTLPYPNAVGLAADGGTLPARLAVTFAGGQVAMVSVQSSLAMALTATRSLSTGVSDAPYWCHCAGSADVIGVTGANGALYLLDPGLGLSAALPAGGPAITTTPSSDAVGEWFFGAADGYLYEVQQPSGTSTLAVTARFGPFGGQVGSAVQVSDCNGDICAYLGASNGAAYLVDLDARDALLSACLSTAPPACSGVNQRLWAKVEVGAAESPQRVHIQGWSYYSP